MIQVDEKETIRRLYFIQRQSIREIARELNHSRKTVRKAITDASVPEYHLTVPRISPVMDPFKGVSRYPRAEPVALYSSSFA